MTDMAGISENVKLIQMIYRFLAFVRMKDGFKEGVPFDFQDENFYFANENYKADTFSKAQKALKTKNWTEEWIDDGRILGCVRDAVKCDENLIYPIQKTALLHKIDLEHADYNPEAARVLYHIYKSRSDADEKSAFNEAVRVFGRHYDTISYLFFIRHWYLTP